MPNPYPYLLSKRQVEIPCDKCGGSGTVPDPIQDGLNMRARRERKKISMAEMARRMGISRAYLCDMEHGRRAFTPKQRQLFVSNLLGKLNIK